MDAKTSVKDLWAFLTDEIELEELDEAFDETIEGFEYKAADITPEMIDGLSDEDASGLLFDINYMASNVFFPDWGTWDEIRVYSLGFDEETMEFLNY